jgi:hypothetical protein
MTGIRSPIEAEDFYSSLCFQTGSGAHPASCAMGTGGPFPGGKARLCLLSPQAPSWRVAGSLYLFFYYFKIWNQWQETQRNIVWTYPLVENRWSLYYERKSKKSLLRHRKYLRLCVCVCVFMFPNQYRVSKCHADWFSVTANFLKKLC